jgi:hypothetical protein
VQRKSVSPDLGLGGKVPFVKPSGNSEIKFQIGGPQPQKEGNYENQLACGFTNCSAIAALFRCPYKARPWVGRRSGCTRKISSRDSSSL